MKARGGFGRLNGRRRTAHTFSDRFTFEEPAKNTFLSFFIGFAWGSKCGSAVPPARALAFLPSPFVLCFSDAGKREPGGREGGNEETPHCYTTPP